MSGESFPLEALLQKREAERDAATQRLGDVQRELAALDDAIHQTEEARDEALRKRAKARQSLSTDLAQMRRVDEYARALEAEANALETQRVSLELARPDIRARLAAARDALRNAQVELEAVSSRKEAWLRKRKETRERAEEAEADELALRRWRPPED